MGEAARVTITVDDWNRKHPVGTEVRYFCPQSGERISTHIVDSAIDTEEGFMVRIAARTGLVSVDHIVPAPPVALRSDAERWNDDHPVGTEVYYHGSLGVERTHVVGPAEDRDGRVMVRVARRSIAVDVRDLTLTAPITRVARGELDAIESADAALREDAVWHKSPGPAPPTGGHPIAIALRMELTKHVGAEDFGIEQLQLIESIAAQGKRLLQAVQGHAPTAVRGGTGSFVYSGGPLVSDLALPNPLPSTLNTETFGTQAMRELKAVVGRMADGRNKRSRMDIIREMGLARKAGLTQLEAELKQELDDLRAVDDRIAGDTPGIVQELTKEA